MAIYKVLKIPGRSKGDTLVMWNQSGKVFKAELSLRAVKMFDHQTLLSGWTVSTEVVRK